VVCLPNLMILNASYNHISDMFEHVELPNLRMLNLAFNALEDLPDKMGEVPNLELLYVSNNKLEVSSRRVLPSRVRGGSLLRAKTDP
jgi:Leucine-rich repeat (LRR) protein